MMSGSITTTPGYIRAVSSSILFRVTVGTTELYCDISFCPAHSSNSPTHPGGVAFVSLVALARGKNTAASASAMSIKVHVLF